LILIFLVEYLEISSGAFIFSLGDGKKLIHVFFRRNTNAEMKNKLKAEINLHIKSQPCVAHFLDKIFPIVR